MSMTSLGKVKIPKSYRQRLAGAASKFKFASDEVFALHLIERGLRQFQLPQLSAPLETKLAQVVEDHGYSSLDEVVEHLLERGLRAYEEPENDPKKLEARLRGLGYID
jgi:hypothetical protein